MQIGKFEIHSLITGEFALDGGAMFGIVPKVIWQKSHPADENNRIKLVTRNLLLISEHRKILIDTGMGDKWEEKFRTIYKIDRSKFSLEKSLAKYNLKTLDITDVIITHFHFDHSGGGTKNVNGVVRPAFENATYYASQANILWALNRSARDAISYIPENIQPLIDGLVLQPIESEKLIFDEGIELQTFNGHTFGQILVKIFDTNNTLFYCGDLIPTSAHIPVRYTMSYDIQPLIAEQEKEKILSLSLENNWKLVFEHDPINAFATVIKTKSGFFAGELYADF